MNSAARQGDSGSAGPRPDVAGSGPRGMDSYTGPQFHCDRWRDQYDLTDRHVAVVGGGAAVARILPAVTARARRVTVFQRDPVWVLPAPPLPGRRLLRSLPDGLLGLLPAHTPPPLPGDTAPSSAAIPESPPTGTRTRNPTPMPELPAPGARTHRAAPISELPARGARTHGFARLPESPATGARGPLSGTVGRSGVAALHRLAGELLRTAATTNLRVRVRDSWQRRQLTPDKAAGVRLHNRYYRALQQPECTLITWPIARIAPLGIRTVDGVEHRVDCIIYAEETP